MFRSGTYIIILQWLVLQGMNLLKSWRGSLTDICLMEC